MSSPTRRRFFEVSFGGLAGAAIASGVQTSQKSRPNIMVVMSDDQSWAHTGAAGDPFVRTPAFDQLAREGVLFTHAFCGSPSCAPSRAALLTGQNIWRLEQGANMRSHLPRKFPTYTDLLEASGYHVGHTGKGWGPGRLRSSESYSIASADERTRNPAGDPYANFDEFLSRRPQNAPFCYWFGSSNPHRPFQPDSKAAAGREAALKVPPFLPDAPEVRADVADYYAEVEAFDRELQQLLKTLDDSRLSANTMIVVTSDNGMGGFPRCKCNLYDFGVRMPLVIRWPDKVKGGRVVEDFVSHTDLAPTFLECAGIEAPSGITGRSLVNLLRSGASGRVERNRDRVFTGRERHSPTRADGMGYPARAMRTYEFLYIRNYAPDRWPAGDPPGTADVDPSPARDYMIRNKENPAVRRLFDLAFARRPAEELYDLKRDPAQMNNVAGQRSYAAIRSRLARELDEYLRKTADPRATGNGSVFDRYPFWS